eukprot:CAMPEP_0114289970 /NCGR_PEP_ID=MMETSP0059-20121206/7671_1 /TAXON_ID=36894 /ORGANISM="Pyramimonas parkeae, Strain CCMP726" /LENGTH=116 /DNA_ID=CAMNT_0001411305 /DNA_START=366 /DNA_END=716 /DNA_ORIENTATION=-
MCTSARSAERARRNAPGGLGPRLHRLEQALRVLQVAGLLHSARRVVLVQALLRAELPPGLVAHRALARVEETVAPHAADLPGSRPLERRHEDAGLANLRSHSLEPNKSLHTNSTFG